MCRVWISDQNSFRPILTWQYSAHEMRIAKQLQTSTSNVNSWAALQGSLWKSIFAFLLLDAYRSLLLKRNEGEWGSSMSFSSIVWTFEEIVVDVFVGNFVFFCIFLLSMRLMLNTSIQISRCKDILLAILVSSYFKIFLIATMVWEFPSSVIFIIDLFVLSSNTVALKVITDSAMNRCIAACFCAQALKLLVTQGPARRSLRF
ncbi:protein ARV 2 isoform X3 [Populus trichocarpa]|uniref:protein ARV 2 isoform X3 n=1 Tax=Populus trichocarpa TaxID=3694 RepID=UPI000D1880AD|nr:protein ARV 2 isoform X3 [Populus trichocarpa]|eukprot:XP_024440338.1 protein arv1 homolog isoform X3 [Populus trichocarpa]